MTAFGTLNSTIETKEYVELTPTAGATVTISVPNRVCDIHAYWTANGIESVVISGSHKRGTRLTCFITNDATLGRLITFSTGITSIGTLLGVVSRISTIEFESNGTDFIEKFRTIGI